jgi:hypothetical protein
MFVLIREDGNQRLTKKHFCLMNASKPRGKCKSPDKSGERASNLGKVFSLAVCGQRRALGQAATALDQKTACRAVTECQNLEESAKGT